MQPETRQSIDDLRSRLRKQKADAGTAFQDFKLKEIAKGVAAIELPYDHADGWQTPGMTPPSKPKSRTPIVS